MKNATITLATLRHAIGIGSKCELRRSEVRTYNVEIRTQHPATESCEPTRAHPMFTAPQLGIRYKNGPQQLAVLDESILF